MIQRIRNQPFAFGNSAQPLSLGMGCPCDEEPVPSMIAAGDEVWAQAAMTPCDGGGVVITGGPDNWPPPGVGDTPGWVSETGWFITGEGFYRYNGSFGNELTYDFFTSTLGDSYTIDITVSGVMGTVYVEFGEQDFYITSDGSYSFQLSGAGEGSFSVGIAGGGGGGVTVESVTVSTLNMDVSAIFHQGGTSTEIAQSDNPEYFEFTNGRVTVHMPLGVGGITGGCFTLELVDNCTETSITSQEFSVVEDDCKTIVIRACNDYDGVGFSGTFVPRIRIPARMGWPAYNSEANEERHSDGAVFRPWADRTGSMTIKTGILNEWDHAFLSTLPLWDHVYIGTGSRAREVVVATGRYEPERGESQWLNGAVVFDVSPKDELVRKVACGPALAGCDPINDPPVFVCAGPGYVPIQVDEAGGAVYFVTTSGYFTLRSSVDESVTTYESATTVSDLDAGTYCAWPSDAAGNYTGEYTALGAGFGAISIFDIAGLAGTGPFQELVFDTAAITTYDIPYLLGATQLYVTTTPLVTLTIDANTLFVYIYIVDCALSEASVINVINAAYASALAGVLTTVDIHGGTSASPPSSVDDLMALLTGTADMQVVGAGATEANGAYTLTTAQNGRDAYVHSNGSEIYWSGTHWNIESYLGDTYRSAEDHAQPWRVTAWYAFGAAPGPDPTVTPPGFGLTITTN